MIESTSQKLQKSGGAEREARELGKVGWMDATDYDHELGHALGGNLVHPDEEDCRKENPCINEIDPYPCQTKEVFVFDKAALEKLWAKCANEARLEALEQAAQQVERCPGERVITPESEVLWILPADAAKRIRALKAAPLDQKGGPHEN